MALYKTICNIRSVFKAGLRQTRSLTKISSPNRCIAVDATSRIITSDAPSIDFVEGKSLPQFLFDNFPTFGDKAAVVDGITGVGYSYAQVQEYSMKIGSALSKLGVKKGDVFAMHCTNCAEFPMVYLAILSLGAIVTTVSPLATVSEMTTQLNNSNAQYIITVPLLAENAKETAKQCDIKHVFVIGEAPGCRPLSLLMQDDGKSFPKDVEINPKEDVAIIPYSSGTTGTPKGVMLTHFNLSCNLQQVLDSQYHYNCTKDDNFICNLPLFHVFGLHVVMGLSLYSGGSMVTLPQFEPEMYLQTLETYKISKVFLPPPLVLFLAKSPLVDKYDISSINSIVCAAAPLSEELQTQAAERLKPITSINHINQGYGMTETGPILTTVPVKEGCHRVASCGTPLIQSEGKIVDVVTGEELGEFERGEICFRGPQVMKGYLNNPEATKATITEDGWIHTGDIGYYDSENYFYCVDRLKELIKYKGYQVAPAELEDILISHPKIQDAAVIGIPDQVGNELPKAFVASTADISKEEIHEFLNKQIAPYKKLRGGIEFVSEIPKSATGKILRRMLRDKESI